MANVVMVLGQSGTGKSTSIKSLNPDETIIIQALKKNLPFKGFKNLYSKEKKNLFYAHDGEQLVRYLKNINEKCETCHTIVIDDATYIMRNEFFDKATETGFGKFTVLAQHFQQVLVTAAAMRDDIIVFIIMHSEEKINDGAIDSYKCATVGKMLDEKFDPVHCVTVLLYSTVRFDGEGKPNYGFYTNRTVENNKVIPAKTPCDMFEDIFIPNDLQFVVDKINEYEN